MSERIFEAYLDLLRSREKSIDSALERRIEIDRQRQERESKAGNPLPACVKCKGTGTVSCFRCYGTGKDKCIICRGSGCTWIGLPPRMMLCSCMGGKVGCVGCNGKGKEPCSCTFAEK